jgi:hypothetical protein
MSAAKKTLESPTAQRGTHCVQRMVGPGVVIESDRNIITINLLGKTRRTMSKHDALDVAKLIVLACLGSTPTLLSYLDSGIVCLSVDTTSGKVGARLHRPTSGKTKPQKQTALIHL